MSQIDNLGGYTVGDVLRTRDQPATKANVGRVTHITRTPKGFIFQIEFASGSVAQYSFADTRNRFEFDDNQSWGTSRDWPSNKGEGL